MLVSTLVLLIAGDGGATSLGFIPAVFGSAVRPAQTAPFWLTPLTATLVHAGPVHLAFNMVMLIFCGIKTEQALGSRAFVLLYVIGAYTAALGQWAVEPSSAVPMIGASGAISAIIGAYALLFGRNRTRPIGPISSQGVQMIWLAASWTALQLMIGLAGYNAVGRIAFAAHIGGFLAGLLLARPLLLWRYRGA